MSLTEVYQALEDCKASLKILLVDACRNDVLSEISKTRRRVQLESVTRPAAAKLPGGIAALFSCSSGQKSFEHPDLQHGLFFHYVIEGLKGSADFDRDREITLPELELYAGSQVKTFARTRIGLPQIPERRGEVRGVAGLATVPAILPIRSKTETYPLDKLLPEEPTKRATNESKSIASSRQVVGSATITVDKVEVKDGAATVGTVKRGTVLTVYEKRGLWLLVTLGGNHWGWIDAKSADFTDEADFETPSVRHAILNLSPGADTGQLGR